MLSVQRVHPDVYVPPGTTQLSHIHTVCLTYVERGWTATAASQREQNCSRSSSNTVVHTHASQSIVMHRQRKRELRNGRPSMQHILVDEVPPGTPSATLAHHSIPPLGPTKLVLLLNSAPTTGSGAVAEPPPPGASPTHPPHHAMPHFAPDVPRPYTPPAQAPRSTEPPNIPEGARSFYESLATLAAALGVTVDTFSVGPQPVGLAAHAPLCEFTGGVCFHYGSLESSAVPQDLCRCGLATRNTCVFRTQNN